MADLAKKKMSEPRLLPVPESLEGERVDAALAKMLGLSRSAAADLISSGSVTLDNQTVLKSHRVSTDQMLEVTLAEKRDALEVVATDVDDLRIVY